VLGGACLRSEVLESVTPEVELEVLLAPSCSLIWEPSCCTKYYLNERKLLEVVGLIDVVFFLVILIFITVIKIVFLIRLIILMMPLCPLTVLRTTI
jgi:hypothetical protein